MGASFRRCETGVLGRDVDGLDLPLAGEGDHGEDAVGVADSAVEGKLAQEEGCALLGLDLTGGHQDAGGDGEVVGGALLLEVGGRQVDGDAAHGEDEAGVLDGGADPLAGLLDGGVREADDGEVGHAVGRDVDLDLDRLTVQADHGAGEHLGEQRDLRGF